MGMIDSFDAEKVVTDLCEYCEDCKYIIDGLREIPSAEPERKSRDHFERLLHEMFDHIWDTKIDHPVFDDTVGDLMAAVLEAFDKVQPESEPQWVSCSEKLPEEKGKYLVTYHPCYWGNVQTDIRVGIDSFRGKTTWAKHENQKVIAWMPLPECYRGEDKNGMD